MFLPTRCVYANALQRYIGRQTRPPKGWIRDTQTEELKLTLRKRLQRKIAEARGISHGHGHQALASPKRSTCSLDDKLPEDGKRATAQSSDGKEGSSSRQLSAKRKYKKHPKPDENAPARPRSAYVIFSNS